MLNAVSPHVGSSIDARKAEDVPEHATKLEPDTPLPAKPEYRMGALGWGGTVGVGLVGGAIGTVVGGVLGLAVDSIHGGPWAGVVMGASILGGAALTGWLAHNGFSAAGAQRHEAAFQAATGSSSLQYARDMIAQYDHDGSGSIELDTANLGSLDERARTEDRRQQDRQRDGEIERWTETRTISAARVWSRADGAPRDQVITDRELATLMANYDAEGDGVLKLPEQEAFAKAHPVAVGDWED